MPELRIPNPFENIGQAIKESLTSDDPEDQSLVTTLFNENNRAIEDAVNNLGITRGVLLVGSWSGTAAGSSNTITWSIPDNGGYYLLGVEAIGIGLPVSANLILKHGTITPTVYTMNSLGGTENTGVSASFGALAGGSAVFDVSWDNGVGTYDLVIYGLAVHVPNVS